MARLPHPRIPLTAALVGLALLAGACGAQRDPAASETAQVGPAVVWAPADVDLATGMPAIGSCHRLPLDVSGGGADIALPVPCSEPHTSRTYAAAVVPANAEDSRRWVARRCAEAFPDALGLAPDQAPGVFVEWVWLQPEEEMRERGARWYRCDVRANRPGGDLQLPGEALPLFTDGVPDAWLRCVDTSAAEPAYVGCDQPHQYRWAGSVSAPAGAHPSREAWEALAAANCRDFVGPDAFWFTYPNRAQWRDGDRRLSCYQRV